MKTLRQFEVVAEIARQESISKAAEVLNVSQPTISKFLHNLESDLKIDLFDRTVTPIRLTIAGERYLAAANKILDVNRQLEKELRGIRENHENILRIGISPSRAPYILPELIAEYRALSPESKIIIKEGNTQQLNDALLRGELDLIISLLTDDTRNFCYEPLFTETVLLAAPQNMSHLTAAQVITTQPIITIGSGLKMWKITGRILEYFGGKEPVIECQSIESALALAKKGLGAMLVPSYIAESKPEFKNTLVYKKLPDDCLKHFHADLHRQVCVFYRNAAFWTEAERCFMEACRSMNHAFEPTL